MNTKKLNEATIINQLNDSEFINVTMADGSIGKIKKSDLYPLATETTNGIMSSDQFKKIKKTKIWLNPGESFNLETTETGIYFIFFSYSGVGCLFLVSSSETSVIIASDSPSRFSGDLLDSSKIALGRKTADEAIFLANNLTVGGIFTIERL